MLAFLSNDSSSNDPKVDPGAGQDSNGSPFLFLQVFSRVGEVAGETAAAVQLTPVVYHPKGRPWYCHGGANVPFSDCVVIVMSRVQVFFTIVSSCDVQSVLHYGSTKCRQQHRQRCHGNPSAVVEILY